MPVRETYETSQSIFIFYRLPFQPHQEIASLTAVKAFPTWWKNVLMVAVRNTISLHSENEKTVLKKTKRNLQLIEKGKQILFTALCESMILANLS